MPTTDGVGLQWEQRAPHWWQAKEGPFVCNVLNGTDGWRWNIADTTRGRWTPTQGECVEARGFYKFAQNSKRYCERAFRKLMEEDDDADD